MTQCDDCIHFACDEQNEEMYCEMEAEMDEDEVSQLMENRFRSCPFYQGGSSDYYLSRRQ